MDRGTDGGSSSSQEAQPDEPSDPALSDTPTRTNDTLRNNLAEDEDTYTPASPLSKEQRERQTMNNRKRGFHDMESENDSARQSGQASSPAAKRRKVTVRPTPAPRQSKKTESASAYVAPSPAPRKSKTMGENDYMPMSGAAPTPLAARQSGTDNVYEEINTPTPSKRANTGTPPPLPPGREKMPPLHSLQTRSVSNTGQESKSKKSISSSTKKDAVKKKPSMLERTKEKVKGAKTKLSEKHSKWKAKRKVKKTEKLADRDKKKTKAKAEREQSQALKQKRKEDLKAFKGQQKHAQKKRVIAKETEMKNTHRLKQKENRLKDKRARKNQDYAHKRQLKDDQALRKRQTEHDKSEHERQLKDTQALRKRQTEHDKSEHERLLKKNKRTHERERAHMKEQAKSDKLRQKYGQEKSKNITTNEAPMPLPPSKEAALRPQDRPRPQPKGAEQPSRPRQKKRPAPLPPSHRTFGTQTATPPTTAINRHPRLAPTKPASTLPMDSVSQTETSPPKRKRRRLAPPPLPPRNKPGHSDITSEYLTVTPKHDTEDGYLAPQSPQEPIYEEPPLSDQTAQTSETSPPKSKKKRPAPPPSLSPRNKPGHGDIASEYLTVTPKHDTEDGYLAPQSPQEPIYEEMPEPVQTSDSPPALPPGRENMPPLSPAPTPPKTSKRVATSPSIGKNTRHFIRKRSPSAMSPSTGQHTKRFRRSEQ